MKNTITPISKPIIRPANAHEANTVAECVRAAFLPYVERMDKPPAPMLADFPTMIEAGKVWVAEMEDHVAGVLVQYETEQGFYIDTVAVTTSYKGTGIGRALLVFAEQEARRRGFQSIYLCTHIKMTENQVLYPKIGYVETERKMDEGYDRVFYRKELS